MTTLTEFLSTADADSTIALGQARAFSEQVLKPIDERMMNERTVMGLIGMESGETFMQSLEASTRQHDPRQSQDVVTIGTEPNSRAVFNVDVRPVERGKD